MKYQWVLFDADETLFHFDNYAGLKRMFSHHGVEFAETEFHEYQTLNKSLWVAYQNDEITAKQLQTQRFQLWSDRLAISTETLNHQFLDAMAEICEPIAGAYELIEYLDRQGICMGIITNGFEQLQRIRLERTGFLPYFSPVVISELVGVAKPNPIIFEQALSEMGNPDKQKVLMVGDTLASDILGGQNIGIDTCWLGHHRENETDIVPTWQANTLTELLDWFKANH
ncbi:pyrimidine 5'-nucleotidase [Marinomonas algarum]|uniref:Pyrimidine 5'-nucleotidase n=1 Tax=Marinomonas algarum TaxID=2883105 RepID=A0A9X1IJA8_9GAMM|nr:pyrimidine 5'-nucleotidase [Marinomonas algarum]MCB5160338.1 pyrimidine 5'-nucleotidase [Marinomonas algarum]